MSNDQAQAVPQKPGRVAAGFWLGIGLNLLQGLLFWLVCANVSGDSQLMVLIVGLGGFGLVQLVFMIPVYIFLRVQHKSETAKGLLIEASLVLLANVSCWAAVYRK